MSDQGDEAFDASQVITTDDFVFFWQPPGVFGQWTWSRFEVEGIVYTCAEQFMMAAKAALFINPDIQAQIMATESPREHKRLGRQIRNFDQRAWVAARVDIVVRGNMATFSQNPEMRAALLATGERTLAEASPLDRIWGIGLRADHPDAVNPAAWRGQNLLGIALMRVRDQLMAERGR